MRESEAAARALGLNVQFAEVAAPAEIESRVAELAQSQVNGIYVAPSTFLASHNARVVTAIAKQRIPALYAAQRYVDAGALVVYSSSPHKGFVRMAGYVDRILKGARPAELPIEQTTDFEMTINLKTAKSLGLDIPQAVRIRADRVIE